MVESTFLRREKTVDDDGSLGTTYAAFISYGHAADGTVAAALRSALQRFAKPWYRLRAIRVFRDVASLPIDTDLRAAIERALDETAYFLLLASPDAARSRYVLAEIRYWLEHKPRETLLLALTDGDLAWDADASDSAAVWP